ADQLITLHKKHHVQVVNPIHLANNKHFGGTAAYSNLFNTLNRQLWGSHFEVRYEPTIGFRFGAPLKMDTDVLPLAQPPFVFKDYASPSDNPESAQKEGLDFFHAGDVLTVDGQANAKGLNDEGKTGLLSLWKNAMIVDIAHMSDLSMIDTLTLSARQGHS